MKRISGELRERFSSQAHVFRFVDAGQLSAAEEDALVAQLEGVNVARVQNLFEASAGASLSASETAAVSPLRSSEMVSLQEAEKRRKDWSKVALEAVSKGQVAFVILSGGQGTRLGFDKAKGMYEVGLPSGKSLFALQAERLRKLQRIAAQEVSDSGKPVAIPWYIMTSPLNDADTRKYFKEHHFFGLKEADVKFFPQGTLPCLTPDGKFILERKDKLAMAPDGNGGIYQSMEEQGVFKDLQQRGVRYIHVSSVDNALVQPADPIFVGYCIEKGAPVGNKGCPKLSWDEKVGVMAKKGGKFNVVEYSELSEELAKQTDEQGLLKFRTGNICNHFFTLYFLKNTVLPALGNSYHVANKKIPFADAESGETVKPTENNGIKLEMFIFDVFPIAEDMAVLDCLREEEFAPVKNASGSPSDSPETAKTMLYALHRSWLKKAGARFKQTSSSPVCEISALVSLRGEGLEDICRLVDEFETPMFLKLKNDEALLQDKPGGVSHHFNGETGIHEYAVCSR